MPEHLIIPHVSATGIKDLAAHMARSPDPHQPHNLLLLTYSRAHNNRFKPISHAKQI